MSHSKTSSRIAKIRTAIVLAGIAIIPLIYAGALTWANQDPTHNLDNVPAAIVNLDEPATAGDTTITLGDDVTKELVDSTASNNFNWIEYDQDDAADALADGDVLAVLTIPEDFSANAASPAEAHPSDAATAILRIETNDGANMISGNIATTIAERVRESLASQVSAEYLEQVYLGINDIHDNVSKASDGAVDLADGAKTAKDGSDSLVVGLGDLADGTVKLNDGAATLSDGASRLSEGATSLSEGLNTLNESAATLPDSATALNDGAAQVASGSSQLADGVSALSTGATTLSTGAATARDAAQTLSDGLYTLSLSTPTAATGAQTLQDGLDGLIANWSLLTDEQKLAALDALSIGAADLTSGVGTIDASVQAIAAGESQLVGSVDEGTGLSALAAGAETLSTNLSTAATSAVTLRDGAQALSAGTQTLADSAPALAAAINSAATGASTLADGASSLSTGASTLSDSTGTLSDGAASAKTGASDLATGLGDLSKGSNELSDGLADGVAQIPTYSDTDAKDLSTVVSDSVKTDATRENEVAGYGYGLAPYFLALSLWVGGLAFYMMFPALNRRALVSGRSSLGVALRSYAPGVLMALAQSALVTAVLLGPVQIHAVNPWGLFGMVVLTSLTFIAINQALISLMGAPGRFFALVMIVLQLSAAGGTYPVQTAPSFFQTIHSWLPLTHALEAFRSLIAGGTLGIENAIFALVVWLVGALTVTTIAVWLVRRSHRVRGAVVGPDEFQDVDDDRGAAEADDADDSAEADALEDDLESLSDVLDGETEGSSAREAEPEDEPLVTEPAPGRDEESDDGAPVAESTPEVTTSEAATPEAEAHESEFADGAEAEAPEGATKEPQIRTTRASVEP